MIASAGPTLVFRVRHASQLNANRLFLFSLGIGTCNASMGNNKQVSPVLHQRTVPGFVGCSPDFSLGPTMETQSTRDSDE